MAQQHPNKFTDIVWIVTEDKLFKDEIILEFHSFVKIISGEMKVVQADRSYLFAAGDTLLFPTTNSRQSLSGLKMVGLTRQLYLACCINQFD